MKLIVTGGTGFVGGEVLRQLDARDVDVTCLSRRPVGSTRAKTILLHDFLVYDEALARTLASHDGCVWALGGKASDGPDAAAYERTTVTITLAFARAVAAQLSKPFRFCYLSGMGADPTESARLPWERTTRHLKGRTERLLSELARDNPLFRATAFRPAGILEPGASQIANVLLAPIAVRVERVAKAMIDEATSERSTPFRVVSNARIRG